MYELWNKFTEVNVQLNTLETDNLEQYQHSRIIEIDRVVNRVGRCNQKRIRPMSGRDGLADGSHWSAAGLSGTKGLDTALDKREASNVDSIDYRLCRRAPTTATRPPHPLHLTF